MKFSDLEFKSHNVLRGASMATHTFANQWAISVVTGHKLGGLYISAEKPYEVVIFLPNGEYLSDDIIPYQTEEDIDQMLEVISRDDIVQKDVEEKFISDRYGWKWPADDYFRKRLFLAK